MDHQLPTSSNGYDHWGRPWAHMDCPAEGLQNVHEDFYWTVWQTYTLTVQAADNRVRHQEAEVRRGNIAGPASVVVSNQIHRCLGFSLVDVIGSSSVNGAATFMQVRHRVHGVLLTLSFPAGVEMSLGV